jgi:hypothetical protein
MNRGSTVTRSGPEKERENTSRSRHRLNGNDALPGSGKRHTERGNLSRTRQTAAELAGLSHRCCTAGQYRHQKHRTAYVSVSGSPRDSAAALQAATGERTDHLLHHQRPILRTSQALAAWTWQPSRNAIAPPESTHNGLSTCGSALRQIKVRDNPAWRLTYSSPAGVQA